MGFISDDKLVVDAVVTKVGRTMLAENNFFPVKFALADDEVDYNLWDETHPQGPDFYGAIIDNMRILEANPNGEPIEMQYKLYTPIDEETGQVEQIEQAPQIEGVSETVTLTGEDDFLDLTPFIGGSDEAVDFILENTNYAYLEVITEDDGLSSDFESIFVFNNGTEVTSAQLLGSVDLTDSLLTALGLPGGITGISQISQLASPEEVENFKEWVNSGYKNDPPNPTKGMKPGVKPPTPKDIPQFQSGLISTEKGQADTKSDNLTPPGFDTKETGGGK